MDYITNPHDAELNAAKVMRGFGYLDARATPVGTDAGLDLISRHIVGQVKNWHKPIGRPALQNLKGSCLDDRHTVFFSLSGYTPQAIEYSKLVQMTLYQYDKSGTTWQVNNVRLPPMGRTWVSTDWIVLLHGLKQVYDLLHGTKNYTNRRSRRLRTH